MCRQNREGGIGDVVLGVVIVLLTEPPASYNERVRRWALPVEIAMLVFVLLAITLRYAPVRSLSWTYDDAFLLRVVNTSDVESYFTSPGFWQGMPAKMFVPALLVWYEMGSRAGGESGFYAVALILLAVALTTSYIALRMWLGVVEALAAVALIGLGPPVVSLVTQLMATHYLIALAFSALAVALYAKAARTTARADGPRLAGWMPAVLSSFFYLLAMLAKEIAVLLPALLLLIPGARRRFIAPHAMALVVYFAWRQLMIGTLLGGYGWAVTSDNVGALILSLPAQIVSSIAPPQWWIATGVLLVLIVPIAWRMRSWRAVAALLIALAPVLPVSREMQPRYVFPLWVTLVVLFAIAARGRAVLCAVAVAVVGMANIAEWNDVYPLADRMSTEARFILRAAPGSTLRLPRIPPAALGELMEMRGKGGVDAFYDDLYLCSGAHLGRKVFEYEAGRVAGISSRIETITRRDCGSIRTNVPLHARFRFQDGTLFWQFGPYERGTWTIVFADGAQAFAVPRNDAFQLGNVPGLALRIRYDSPEGWSTYSETIHLDFTQK
jgi:hypothetical protein